MIDGMPWSVKGVEPDIRDDALHAAHSSGLTLGQWLNGVIRDSLVDLKAARGTSGRSAHFSSMQQETARQTMQHFSAQQPYPYAPMPPVMGHPMMPPPYAMPAPMGYPAWPQPPAPPAYDPIEARLRHYRAATETAIASVPGNDQRMLSVIDAAVDAMQNSVRASEQKTVAALEALTTLIERGARSAPVAPASVAPASVAPAAPAQPAPATAQASAEAEQLARTLGALVDRLGMLEKSLADVETRRSSEVTAQAKRIEDRISEALDSLAAEPQLAPAAVAPPAPAAMQDDLPVRAPQRVMMQESAPEQPYPRQMSPVQPSPRPRIAMARSAGANAIADIAARQRMLDADDAPKAQGSSEAAALDAIRRSIAALADQVREQQQKPGVAAPVVDDQKLRAELRDLQKTVQDLAPGKVIASVNESLKALAGKIEQSRQGGVREAQLAPIEKLLADMRVAMDTMREPRAMSAMTSTLEQLARRVEDLGARSVDARQLTELQAQFADLRAVLDEARQHQPAGQIQDQISRLHAKLDSLTENPRDSRLVNLVAEAVEDMRKNLRRYDPERIVARIDERMAGLDDIGARLTDLSNRVDGVRAAPAAPADTSGFDSITRQIEWMTRSLSERSQGPDLSPIVERIDAMRAALASRPAAPDLSALENRIADIQSSLQQRPAQPDMKGLEQILRKLADRIETVRAPAASGASLDALQTQVLALAERLDRSGGAMPAFDGMERTLTDLVQKVGTLKDTTVSATEKAIRTAIAQQPPGGGGMDPLAAEGMILIKRDLTEMKSAQAESEVRSRETLQLVNTTLEKIVSRLATLEGEFSKPRPLPQPAPQAVVSAPAQMPPSVQVPPQDLAGNHSRITPALSKPVAAEPRRDMPAPQTSAPVVLAAADSEPDLPLEPGAGRNGMPVAGPGEPDVSGDPRSSFIAAARRAAQAAAAQTSAVLTELDEKKGVSKKAAAALDGKFDGVKGYIAQRRKPLLLGLAALVFALGGLKVATSFMGGEEPVNTGSIAPVEPVPTPAKVTAAPKAAPASVLDKRLADAEAVVAAAPLPRMVQQQIARDQAEADPTSVGSLGERAPAVQPVPQAAPVDPVQNEAMPTDVKSLFKASAFTGPERLKQAAVNGNLAAIYEIGSRLAEGRGTPRDVKAATGWLEFAAQQGYAPAQYRLGSFSREGLGVTKDAKKAFGWFQRAAEQGHILAMHNLAVLYAEGVNGAPDYGAAATWFRNAAEYGVKDSQFNIAILNVRGLGVANDMTEAYKWFAAAAAQGDGDAIKKRDEVAARLTPDKLAEAKAIVESFRAKKPDARANDVAAPEGGWDQAQKAPAPAAKGKTKV